MNEVSSDPAKIEQIYRSLCDPLTRLAFLLIGDREEARDIVQSVFATAAGRWSTIEDPHSYLRRAVVNRANDSHRRSFRRAAFPPLHPLATGEPDLDGMWEFVQLLPRYATLLRRTLRHAASTFGEETQQPLAVESLFVPVLDRRPPAPSRRVSTVVGAAAALVAIVVVAIVVMQGRHQSSAGHTRDRSPLAAYDLTLPSARLTNDETGDALDTDAAVWSHDDGTYLTLTVRFHFTSAPAGVGPTSPVSAFPAARGQAWYGETETPTDVSDDTSVSSLLWWQQPNGDLWLMHAYWYGAAPPQSAGERQQRLIQWALDIKNPAEGSYDLVDGGITSVAHERSGTRRTRTRIWNVDNHQVVLLVIEDSSTVGLSNALAFGQPRRVYVDSRRGWSSPNTTNPTNDITVSWSVSDLTNDWAILTIPAALADRADEIISAIHLAA